MISKLVPLRTYFKCGFVKMRELVIAKPSTASLNIPKKSNNKHEFIYKIIQSNNRRISIELSPNNDFNLKLLTDLNPEFVSVTWLGTSYLELPNSEIPAVVLARKLVEGGFPVLLHLAGRNLNKSRMLEILNELQSSGIKNVLALQGDWPHVLEKDDAKCDFPYAADLISFIKDNFGDGFSCAVAAYPDVHPRCRNLSDEIKFLKQKVLKGADFIITQAVFDYDTLENFTKTCRIEGISIPIIPGIFIIKTHQSLVNMAKWCEFKVPQSVMDFVEKNQDKPDVVENYGVDLARKLISKILENRELYGGGVHIFSMNNMELVGKVV